VGLDPGLRRDDEPFIDLAVIDLAVALSADSSGPAPGSHTSACSSGEQHAQRVDRRCQPARAILQLIVQLVQRALDL
jgi:hypothetical protein